MYEIADEKYSIASMMLLASRFTLKDIAEKLGLDEIPDAVYTVLGEMLDKEFLEISHQTDIVFDLETRSFSDKEVKIYCVLPQKEEELQQYIKALGVQRLQPDKQGRPRGLNYRIAEQLIERVSKNRKQLEKEKEAIEQYLILAQEDEVSMLQGDQRQSALSDAYLRMLYGEYLVIKEQRMDAIVQFLKASHLFQIHEILDKSGFAEDRANKAFVEEYESAMQGQVESNLLEFRQSIKKTLSLIEGRPRAFLALVEHISKQITEEVKPDKELIAPEFIVSVPMAETGLVDKPPITLLGGEPLYHIGQRFPPVLGIPNRNAYLNTASVADLKHFADPNPFPQKEEDVQDIMTVLFNYMRDQQPPPA